VKQKKIAYGGSGEKVKNHCFNGLWRPSILL